MKFRANDIAINTFIGAGAKFTGNISVVGFMRIDGDVLGDIEATDKIIISERARIRGNVTAKSVVVGGVVQGNIIAAETVFLFSTAAVFGDVFSRNLQVEANVLINGRCLSLENEDAYNQALAAWQDMRIIKKREVSHFTEEIIVQKKERKPRKVKKDI